MGVNCKCMKENKGKSTLVLARAMLELGSQLYCICIVPNYLGWPVLLHGSTTFELTLWPLLLNDVVLVRILTNSNPSEHFLHRTTEFSFTDGIDNRVAYCAEEENTRCGKIDLGWNIDSWEEQATNACNPERNKAHQKRSGDNGDIDSGLAIS